MRFGGLFGFWGMLLGVPVFVVIYTGITKLVDKRLKKKNLPDDCKFYADFYSGRLYDKSDSYKTRALNRFVFAMQESLSDENFDNALWYYLNCLLKISVPKTIDAITQYKDEWKNPSYFDDFFETLSVRLLSLHAWNDFYKTTDLIYGKASPEISAKYSYISARLIQENFIKTPK